MQAQTRSPARLLNFRTPPTCATCYMPIIILILSLETQFILAASSSSPSPPPPQGWAGNNTNMATDDVHVDGETRWRAGGQLGSGFGIKDSSEPSIIPLTSSSPLLSVVLSPSFAIPQLRVWLRPCWNHVHCVRGSILPLSYPLAQSFTRMMNIPAHLEFFKVDLRLLQGAAARVQQTRAC